MLIGELSRRSGFSKDTIRYYEKIELISLPKRSIWDVGYKNYPEAVLKRLLVIKKLKTFGFTLQEIHHTIVLFEEDLLDCNQGKKYLEHKINLIEKKVDELKSIQKTLRKAAIDCESKCSIKEILSEMN